MERFYFLQTSRFCLGFYLRLLSGLHVKATCCILHAKLIKQIWQDANCTIHCVTSTEVMTPFSNKHPGYVLRSKQHVSNTDGWRCCKCTYRITTSVEKSTHFWCWSAASTQCSGTFFLFNTGKARRMASSQFAASTHTA